LWPKHLRLHPNFLQSYGGGLLATLTQKLLPYPKSNQGSKKSTIGIKFFYFFYSSAIWQLFGQSAFAAVGTEQQPALSRLLGRQAVQARPPRDSYHCLRVVRLFERRLSPRLFSRLSDLCLRP